MHQTVMDQEEFYQGIEQQEGEQLSRFINPYKEYKQVFEIEEVANLTPEEMNEYQQSLKIQRDNIGALRYAKKEGIAKGEHKKAVEMARQMLLEQEPLDKILRYTQLSIEEIKSL